MALTPAEKQRASRERQAVQERSRPDAIEHALLQDVVRAGRGELSREESAALADALSDLASRHLRRAQELAELARKVRPPDWVPPGFPPRR